MQEYLSTPLNKRQEIIEKIKHSLLEEKDVIFAYVFGSFLSAPSFRDVDIGIYVENRNKTKKNIFDYELELSKKIADTCGLPFDVFEVKILNSAPSHFLNNIFKNGKLLFSKKEEILSSLIENSSLDAIANEYVAYQSLKELIPA